jgi:NAD(P)-dependent dehydrogenase (short-subunit alcohol dehydrogenase family)
MEKTFIITGGNSGLGRQCAKNIAMESRDNHVVIASRNMEKSQKAVMEITGETGNPHVYALSLDLASLTAVRNFSKVFSESKLPPLYGLVCNAIGGYTGNSQYTEDGFETTFGTGHLGHFLLANLLLRNMQDNGRIIFVSSDQHNPPGFIGKIHYSDALDFAYPKDNKHVTRYSGTKLCNIYCAYEMAARIQTETDKNITVNAFNPAFMADTEMGKNVNTTGEKIARLLAPLLARLMGLHSSAAISGKLLAEYMTDAKYEGITGKYFDREKETKSSELSYNKANAVNLRERSIELTHLQQDETVFKCSSLHTSKR